MQKTKLLIISIFTALSLGLVTPLVIAQTTSAAGSLFSSAKEEACGGAKLSGSSQDCSKAQTNGLDSTVQKGINFLTVIVGVVAVISIIINGLRYVLSGGDSNKVSSAKNGIIYAIVGIIIVALAQVIVKYFINATGK